MRTRAGSAVDRDVRTVPDATRVAERPRRGPGSKADADHPTRRQLLDAAMTLLDTPELSELSVADLARAAGVAKGTFYVHFADRDAFVLALHRWFHDDLVGAIEAATASLPPGSERLAARLNAFLDGCRGRSGVRSMLWSASRQPAIRGEVERRNQQATAAVADDLRAMERVDQDWEDVLAVEAHVARVPIRFADGPRAHSA
jgi:AcrR family transcriptional regulator